MFSLVAYSQGIHQRERVKKKVKKWPWPCHGSLVSFLPVCDCPIDFADTFPQHLPSALFNWVKQFRFIVQLPAQPLIHLQGELKTKQKCWKFFMNNATPLSCLEKKTPISMQEHFVMLVSPKSQKEPRRKAATITGRLSENINAFLSLPVKHAGSENCHSKSHLHPCRYMKARKGVGGGEGMLHMQVHRPHQHCCV